MIQSTMGCCDDVKDRKNESHSQHEVKRLLVLKRCCDDVKDRKNESHSQLPASVPLSDEWCCDDVKDRKNESHSQRILAAEIFRAGVVTMSKIGKMKAIHNREQRNYRRGPGVVTMSKIGKMKAIHNLASASVSVS